MSLNVAPFKGARSLQSKLASILCGVLLVIPLSNVGFAADPKVVVAGLLDQAIPEFQKQMASMSQGCGGGPGGKPPLNWQGRQTPGNEAVAALSKARAALGEGRIDDVKAEVTSGLTKWNQLINSLAQSCEGGPHGEDPVSYGNYVRYRDVMGERLRTALLFL